MHLCGHGFGEHTLVRTSIPAEIYDPIGQIAEYFSEAEEQYVVSYHSSCTRRFMQRAKAAKQTVISGSVLMVDTLMVFFVHQHRSSIYLT